MDAAYLARGQTPLVYPLAIVHKVVADFLPCVAVRVVGVVPPATRQGWGVITWIIPSKRMIPKPIIMKDFMQKYLCAQTQKVIVCDVPLSVVNKPIVVYGRMYPIGLAAGVIGIEEIAIDFGRRVHQRAGVDDAAPHRAGRIPRHRIGLDQPRVGAVKINAPQHKAEFQTTHGGGVAVPPLDIVQQLTVGFVHDVLRTLKTCVGIAKTIASFRKIPGTGGRKQKVDVHVEINERVIIKRARIRAKVVAVDGFRGIWCPCMGIGRHGFLLTGVGVWISLAGCGKNLENKEHQNGITDAGCWMLDENSA